MFFVSAHENLPLFFESCGHFVSRGEWIHPQRVISSYEILLVLSGKVYLQEEGQTYTLEKNHLLLLSPGKRHGGTRSSRNVSFYWMHFTCDVCFGETHFILSEGDAASLFGLFRMLLHDVHTPFYPPSSAEYLTRLILNEIHYLSDKQGHDRSIPHRAAEYVAANLAQRPTVPQVAEHFGYHPDYLCRLFRKTFGQSLKAFIAEQTLQQAKQLLRQPEISMAEIARELGFESANLFTKFFKYHEGITPTRYMSMYYNTHVNHR